MAKYGTPLVVSVCPEMRAELQELADAAGATLTAFIRDILEEYLTTGVNDENEKATGQETVKAFSAAAGK